MRRTILFIALAAIAVGCNGKNEADTTSQTKQVAMALPVSYSSSFEMGKSQDAAAAVVQGSWKDWQDANMGNMKNWMADSVVLLMSDNKRIVGIDSAMAEWKRARSKYSNVIDTINAVLPVYSKDKKENWVLVWATEMNTSLEGKKDTMQVMETWRINKDGKADLVMQYDRHSRKM
ncbi:MAG: hypothetical protein M3040_17435 [Bacteroidota bacterium]|nr:hypothetical protein [Bacteroidota bacterium]